MTDAHQEPGQIGRLLAEVAKEVKGVPKSSQNPEFGYAYRGIDDVLNHLGPLLARHGLVVLPRILEHDRQIHDGVNRRGQPRRTSLVTLVVEYTFLAPDGSSVSLTMAGEGADSADKAVPKALSTAYKYAMFQAFSIPTQELPDTEAEPDQDELAPQSETEEEEGEGPRNRRGNRPRNRPASQPSPAPSRASDTLTAGHARELQEACRDFLRDHGLEDELEANALIRRAVQALGYARGAEVPVDQVDDLVGAIHAEVQQAAAAHAAGEAF